MLGTVDLPTPDEVVLEAIDHLGDGPVFVPGEANRQLFEKVNHMPRRDAAERMARIAYKLVGRPA